MPPNANATSWDIFCNVIDNYGDIGVCWRLARQLATEFNIAVHLWVDDLQAFKRICPEIDAHRAIQMVQGVEVRLWAGDVLVADPGDVVIEAFACQLPEQFVRAMATRQRPPVWVQLDYLSAEVWVTGCHGLPSPHLKLPLTKYFFFPGFCAGTGGLLREQDLDARRQSFIDSPEQQRIFWQELGTPPPSGDALNISLFAYENLAIPGLMNIWAQGVKSVCCFAPVTRTLPLIESFVGRPLQVGDIVRTDRLEIRILPFVAQEEYDKLLWSCDINFVRGEDSFARAQWAKKPMVWQIYPQDDNVHRVKLEAFLEFYCSELSTPSASSLRELFLAWNGEKQIAGISKISWSRWIKALPELQKHSCEWANSLKNQEDLCGSLVRFCRSKL